MVDSRIVFCHRTENSMRRSAVRSSVTLRLTALLSVILGGFAHLSIAQQPISAASLPSTSAHLPSHQQAFSIRSPDFIDNGTVADSQLYNGGGGGGGGGGKGGCQGANQSPAIQWQHAPAGTVSFAITLFDPDAPGRGWWHWAVANIPASIHRLPANASASGALAALGAVQARNDFDDDGYSGPCPPAGTVHRYILTVYALSSSDLRVEAGRPAPFFEHEIVNSTIAKASITVRNRPRAVPDPDDSSSP